MPTTTPKAASAASAPPKAPRSKSAPSRAPAKKAAPKKASSGKTCVCGKASGKHVLCTSCYKASAKKAPAKKAPAKKAPAKKAPAKKTAPKKASLFRMERWKIWSRTEVLDKINSIQVLSLNCQGLASVDPDERGRAHDHIVALNARLFKAEALRARDNPRPLPIIKK